LKDELLDSLHSRAKISSRQDSHLDRARISDYDGYKPSVLLYTTGGTVVSAKWRNAEGMLSKP
jgi:hypothetical protein